MAALQNVVVVGGSFVGWSTAQKLAAALPATHRVLLVEPHTHFHHLFAFPRFAVLPGAEHKGFVPYTGIFSKLERHRVICARADQIGDNNTLILDRTWDETGSRELPFAYLVIATGCQLTPPGTVPAGVDDKLGGVAYFRGLQADVADAPRVCIVGGGAVGLQLAFDLKEVYPSKDVTVVHSRAQTMVHFDPALHEIVTARCAELGIDLVLGSRAVVPPGGFPSGVGPADVVLLDGRRVPSDLVIVATGQTPNNALAAAIPDAINEGNGFLRVLPTLQLDAESFENVYAVGDIADTGSHKAARPGMEQANVVVKNIMGAIGGHQPAASYERAPAAIHMTLGLRKNVLFVNPPKPGGKPHIVHREDGRDDMGVERVWKSRGVDVTDAQGFYL